jgi:hypothetical protein
VGVAITTKNDLKRIIVPDYQSTATVSCSIPATTEGVVAPRRTSNKENCILSALRYPLVTTSLQKLFLQGNPMLQLCWKLN